MQRVKEYTESYFLPAGECNPQQEMPVTLVARHIIDIATMHANLLDVGYARLVEDGLTWVLSRLSIEMYRYPGINESYSLSTWIEGFNRHFSERNFELTAESGEVLGHCGSVWVPINIRRRESGALEALESLSDVVSERRCPIDKQPRMTALGDEGTRSNDYRFRYCDCDFNRHVNAVRYMELYLNQWDMDFHDEYRIKRFDISYQHEAYCGDEVKVKIHDAGDDTYLCEIAGKESVHTRARIIYTKRNNSNNDN